MEKSESAEKTKVAKTPRLPVKEEDLKNLAQRVAERWKADGMELRWKKPVEFQKEVEEFSAIMSDRGEKGDKRKPLSLQLRELDEEIDKNTEAVKTYVKADFGLDVAESYYPQFGIEKSSKSYKLPKDRDGRLRGLKKMLEALAQYNMTSQKFGKTYWEGILSRYEPLLKETALTDGIISEKVKDKNVLRDEIKKTLNSLMKLIEAHYPDNYQAVWRSWGFQKTKY